MKRHRSIIAVICAAFATVSLTQCGLYAPAPPPPYDNGWEEFDDNPADTTVTEPTDSTDIDIPNDSTEIPE